MAAFDKQKLADMKAEESRLAAAFQEVCVKLNDNYETDQWDENKLTTYMADQQRHAQLDRELKSIRERVSAYEKQEPEAVKRNWDKPLSRFIRKGSAGLDESERKVYCEGADVNPEAFGAFGNVGNVERFIIKMDWASDAASGQEAKEETTVPRVIDQLAYYGGVAQMAQQFMTATGSEYNIPNVDDVANTGEIIAAQNTAVTALDVANITATTFNAKTASSKSIGITREMVTDSVFDVQSYVERQAVRRLGRVWNLAFTKTQTGTGLPIGVENGARNGITTASATAITWVEATRVQYSIDRAYRDAMPEGENGMNAEMGGVIGYMISDDAERVLSVLVDGDSRPLWRVSAREGAPATFSGYPVRVNGAMDAVTTGNVPILFGNFSYYGIRTVNAVEIFRFMDSRTMQTNSVECLAFSRRDGRYMGATDSGRCQAVARVTTA